MYLDVGVIPTPRRWADLAPTFSLKPCEQGYASTDRVATKALYEPLLHETFPGRWVGASLAIIWCNGSIPPHQDGDEAGTIRRYLAVLQSNPGAWCLHDGTWQQLEEGRIYEMELTKTHAAINWGSEPRIHLVVDIAR